MFDAGPFRCETIPFDEPIDLTRMLDLRGEVALFYWEQPDCGVTIVAAGEAARFEAAGPTRFSEVSQSSLRAMATLTHGSNHAPRGHGPLAVGGFGFSDRHCAAPEWREFPPARLILPELLWIRRGPRCTLTRIWASGRKRTVDALLARIMAPRQSCLRTARQPLDTGQADDLERREWRDRVERVRSRIIAGGLRKVVLSRRLAIEGIFDPVPILEEARRTRRSCFNFCLSAGATSFVGSTPERLVRIAENRVVSGALAGSAPRGATVAEDDAFGESLLASSKNREEHDLVLSAIRSALEPITAPLPKAEEPHLVRLPEVQHLFTGVEGHLRDRRSVVEVAGLLHPTPAVCGVPREAALAIIEREETGRGWYTGAVGWMDASGQGEFAVALRSGVIDGMKLFLWAGAGIVGGSDPEAEFAETEIKMSALVRDGILGTAS